MRIFRQRRQNRNERRLALAGVAVVRPDVGFEDMADGNVRVSLSMKRGEGLFERMRPPETIRRYELDAFGTFVISQIDGTRTVLDLVDAFEKRFAMSRRDVELSVVAFIKLLMQRHIVSVVVPSTPAGISIQGVAAVILVILGCSLVAVAEPQPLPPTAAVSSATTTIAEMRALFADTTSVLPGSAGNLALEDAVAQRFRESGFETGEIVFDAPAFIPGALTLDGGEQGQFRLEAMHPTLMRPGNFAELAFDARLVYLGKGGFEDLERLEGIDLNEAIAVMDFDCGDQWKDVLRFGIKGIVFVWDRMHPYEQSVAKLYDSEVSIPRFFADGTAGERLRQLAMERPGLAMQAQAEPSRWTRSQLRDLWTLIPGSDEILAERVLVLTAPLDSNSVVPSRAQGAQRAVNLHVLLKLLEDFREQKPLYSVLLVAVNGHTQRYAGERQLAWHLMADEADVEAMRNEIASEMRIARLHAVEYGKLQLEPVAPADKPDLHIMMEVLWKLDAQQREVREQARQQVLQQYESMIAEAINGSATLTAEDLIVPERDETLDLAAFTATDLQAAIDQAEAELTEAYEGFFAKRGRDPDEVDQEKAEDLAMLASLRDMPFEAFMTKASRVKSVFDDEKRFERWRATLDASTGQRIYVKTKLQDDIKSQVNRTMQDMLFALSPDKNPMSEGKRAEWLSVLGRQRDDLRKVLVLFNKMDLGVGRSRTYYRQIAVNDVQRDILKANVDRFVTQYGRWQTIHEATLKRDVESGAIRRVVGRRKVALVIALEADAHAERFGLSSFSPRRGSGWYTGFATFCNEIAAAMRPGELYVDALTGDLPPAHFFHSPESGAYYFHVAQNTPAFSLKSAFSHAGRLFSPDDTFDALAPDAVERLQSGMRAFIHGLLGQPDILGLASLKSPKPWGGAWSILLRTYNLEQFTGKPIPTEPVPNSLVALYEKPGNSPPMLIGDVVNCYLGISDATANVYFYGIGEPRPFSPAAYQMDETFREVLYTIDKGRVQSSRQMTSNVNRSPRATLPMFRCREYVIKDRRDPTAVASEPIDISSVWPKKASGRSDPDKYGAHGIDTLSPAGSHGASGPFAIYLSRRRSEMEQDSLMMITASKRCVLNATPENPEGEGFRNPEALGDDIIFQTSADMALLNKSRNADMQGVVNQLLDDFIAQGDQLHAATVANKAAHAHTGYLRTLYEAAGNQVKAYRELSQMNADMLKAVIVYMALMLPFCFFLQKLLFNFKRLEHELAGFSALFVSMFVVFRLIHPAFRLAMSPEAIFIAFVLGAIGVFTTMVLRSRFNQEMSILFRGVGGIGDEVGYGTVGSTAMLIGVQNMRRRRVRTTLTTVTIVLVVFTMLAFSSVSRKAKPTLLPKADSSPYTGLFYHWPNGEPMDEATYRTLRDLFADRARIRVRRMLQSSRSIRAPQHSWRLARETMPDAFLEIKAITGLPPDDPVLRDSMALVEGEVFSSSDAQEVFLSTAAASAMRLGAADVGKTYVRLLGREWLLKGLFDDQRYRLARDLDPNLPLVPFGIVPKAGGDDALDEEIPNLNDVLIDTASLAIIPDGAAAQLGALPRSMAIVFPDTGDDTLLGNEIRRVLTVTEAKFFVGSREPFKLDADAAVLVKPGVYYVGSSYRTAIGGLAKLLIPLIIAGSIILNTMLGTVYERKSEIAVFNAIGLNPTHIFMFFLAEAIVYSIIGAVGGYMIGQVLTIAFKAAGLIQDVNINFSSLVVVYAILFTMALVILSTVYPGYVATRTAVPSGKRKWTMPDHDGHHMRVVFPFIYRPRLAYGVMCYLQQFFAPMSDQSMGDMLAKLEDIKSETDPAGHPVLTLRYNLALAPYDLGVTQNVTFTTRYDEIVSSFRLHMDVDRVSGHDTNWVTTNKPFLERMRKYLIRWRNIDPTRQASYVKHAVDMFTSGTPPLADGIKE